MIFISVLCWILLLIVAGIFDIYSVLRCGSIHVFICLVVIVLCPGTCFYPNSCINLKKK